MFEFLKKKKDTVDFALSPISKECIPYACHYDDHTVLTKNGELMQVIKIESIIGDKARLHQEIDIREAIRQAILKNVTDIKVSVFFHTIRQKRNLDSINKYSWTFAKDTHNSWAKKNYWRDKFVNELYISLLYEGEDYTDHNKIYLSFIPKSLKKLFLSSLVKSASKLSTIAQNILENLKEFGAHRLKVEHDRFGAHSQILEFIAKITCLHSKRIPLPVQGIDSIFAKTKIAFGGNTLEIVDEKEKHFAAIFTIKEYHEINYKNLDPLLRVASEYVITQAINFVDSKEAKKHFEYFDYILNKVSKDSELRKECGLKSIIESDTGSSSDYCSQQMTMMIMAQSLPELQRSVNSIMARLKSLGIVVIREDLHISLCFWSQIPGNFHFYRRHTYINTGHTASFSSLYNSPSGRTESVWGNALTLFRRENASPHFFNFHVENNGNTLIVGQHESSKVSLVNFLLSESSKYDPRILYIDQFSTSMVTMKALGGRYATITLQGDKPAFNLNPFAMKDSEENRDFLKKWILYLAFSDDKHTEAQQNILNSAIDDLFANIAVGSRQISTLLTFIEDEEIKNNLLQWCKPNKFGLLFDNQKDDMGIGAKALGLNIDELMIKENLIAVPAFVSYCMHQYKQLLDNSPAIIAIHDANLLLEHKIFAETLPNWLDSLTNNNALAILVCNSKNTINANITNIQDKISTQLFLPPEITPKQYQEAFNLSDQEISIIRGMKALYRQFLIKQQNDAIIVELNLDGMEYAVKALAGKSDAIEAMNKAILEIGDNPNRWIVPFYKNLSLGE